MDPIVPLVLSHGWAAGVNAYLTVALFCLTGRLGIADVPAVFERNDVLAAALVMAAVELVVDKIPVVDSLWDMPHTIVRPVIGGLLGAEIADAQGGLDQALAALGGGTTALASHSVKAGLRLAVNTSPEPFTNFAVSTAEDGAVGLVSFLAAKHPYLALGASLGFLISGALLVVLLARQVRRGLRRVRARRAAARAP
jgi:hypothetical protein